MNARCPKCQVYVNVRVRRGDKVSNHSCPTCSTTLTGAHGGTAKGRYRCPISGWVYTLGQRAYQLTEPMRLEWAPGWVHSGEPDLICNEPYLDHERKMLARVAGKVLGPGCVVGINPNDGPVFHDRGRLRLQPAGADAGDPADWIVNAKLTYRKCAACPSRAPDEPERRMPAEWKPRRSWYPLRGQRGTAATDPGPHPAGSIACCECDPRLRNDRLL